jgi:hypothetical protein
MRSVLRFRAPRIRIADYIETSAADMLQRRGNRGMDPSRSDSADNAVYSCKDTWRGLRDYQVESQGCADHDVPFMLPESAQSAFRTR